MISLGCAKNLVDAEIMLGSVLQRGMEITARAEEADVLVINTCAFIDSAKEESIEAILEAHQQRGLSKRSNQKLIVSGCMSQRFAREPPPTRRCTTGLIAYDRKLGGWRGPVSDISISAAALRTAWVTALGAYAAAARHAG